MKHLRGSLTVKTPLREEENDNVRYRVEKYGGRTKLLRSNIKCCVCEEYLWVEAWSDDAVHLIEGFSVIDPRAYKEGVTPDYMRIPNCLLECHWTCKEELERQLNQETFIAK